MACVTNHDALSKLDCDAAIKRARSEEALSDVFSQNWASVLSGSGLSELKDGEGYALVCNGPRRSRRRAGLVERAPVDRDPSGHGGR